MAVSCSVMQPALARMARKKFTAAEYLLLEREAVTRSELFRGEILAMAGASEPHSLIATNLAAELRGQMRRQGCRTYASDMRVATAPGANYFYPDVVVVCGKLEFDDRRRDTLLNPVLVVEVLSESTRLYDRRIKLEEYRLMASIRTVLLVSQDRPRVEVFTRRPSRQWATSIHTRMTDLVEIAEPRCAIAMAEIYDGVEFPGR